MPKSKKDSLANKANTAVQEYKYTRYFVKNDKYKSGLKRVNFLNSNRYELEYIRLALKDSHRTQRLGEDNKAVIYRTVAEYGLISTEQILKIQQFLIAQIEAASQNKSSELNLVDMLNKEFSKSLDEFTNNLRPFYIAPIQELAVSLQEQKETINDKLFCFNNYIFSNLSAKYAVRAKISTVRLDTIKGYREKLFQARPGSLPDDIRKLRVDHDKALWSAFEDSKPIENEDIVLIITLEKP